MDVQSWSNANLTQKASQREDAPAWEKDVSFLEKKWSSLIEDIQLPKQGSNPFPIIYLKKEGVLCILRDCKYLAELKYPFLVDLTASDERHPPRFHIIYHLLSHQKKQRLCFKVRLQEEEKIPSITEIWEGANWAEREVYDMFGIFFENHPDLRRILMDPRWVGYPLRKDYPIQDFQIFTESAPTQPAHLK